MKNLSQQSNLQRTSLRVWPPRSLPGHPDFWCGRTFSLMDKENELSKVQYPITMYSCTVQLRDDQFINITPGLCMCGLRFLCSLSSLEE